MKRSPKGWRKGFLHRKHTSRPRLSTNVNIESRVAELVHKGAEKAEVTVVRVLQELSRLGFSDIRRAFDADGSLLAPSEWDDDFAASVASIEVVTKTLPGQAGDEMDAQPQGGALARRRNAKVEYVHKIKVWDKNSALEKLAKHLGMFVERHEHTGPDGAPIRVEHSNQLADLTDEEREMVRGLVTARARKAADDSE